MSEEISGSNENLESIFNKDQSDRLNNPNPTPEEGKNIFERDKNRRLIVKQMIDKGELKTPQDYVHAAFIFQHGETSEDYLKANELAKKAVDMGDEKAKWIYAATMDRYLLSIGKPQQYGTQYEKDKDGNWVLSEVDPSTTDEERAEHFIKPLSEIQKLKPENEN